MKKLIALVKNKTQLFMIGGRPAVGKTTLSLQIIVELAKYSKCLVYSLEMGAKQIESKVISICKEQNIGYNTIKNNIVIDDCYNLTIQKLKEDCLKNKYDYVIIDYLQLLFANNKLKDRNKELSNIVKDLKQICEKLNLSIIVNSMAHRDCKSRLNNEILLKDFRIDSINLFDNIIIINESDTDLKKIELYNKKRQKTELNYIWNKDKLLIEDKE